MAAALVIDQSRHLFGLPVEGAAGDTVVRRLWAMLTHAHAPNVWTLGVGVATVGLVFILRRISRRLGLLFPVYLMALAIMAALAAACGLQDKGVRLVGAVPAAAPTFQIPHVSAARLRELAGSAVAVGLLGLFESLAIAQALAARSGRPLDVRQQCLSDGLANFAGSFFGCFPGAGSFTRSTLNYDAGARTQWAAVFGAVAVAAAMLPVAPLARFVPRSALAGLLILAAWRLIDRRQLAGYLRRPGWASVGALAMAVITVAVSVECAVLAGIGISVALRKMESRQGQNECGRDPGGETTEPRRAPKTLAAGPALLT
jgi:SulP family sulfate permease